MAKKKKKTIELPEPVANCDHHDEVATNRNFENMDIKSMIRVIRGQQVMLDSDLAMLYGVETRALNQAVKRNIGRFPDDFMFQLTRKELETLKSQIVLSNVEENQADTSLTSQNVILKKGRGQHTKYTPHAFTRNGIGMLSSVLSRYYEQFQVDLKKHNEQYPTIKFVQLPHRNHDRFLVVDDDVYLLGASVKDMGIGLCAVTKLQTSPETILGLLK